MKKIFNDQTVIISGGLGDIGKAIALQFASLGASVAVCDIQSITEARLLIDQLQGFKVKASYHQVDVTDAMAVKEWVDDVEKTIGIPNLVIANAATVTLAGIHQITPEQWSRELRVNLDGAFFLTQIATAKLREKLLPGKVVFVGSWAGESVHPHIPAYSVSKAGMRMLCKCMALELAPYNILVNEIAPGYVAAGLTGKIWKDNPGQSEKSIQKVPIKKVISAEQVAEQIVYLCSPDNIHMTGSTLLMDGGLSLL